MLTQFQNVIDILQRSYDCFGITCQDVGAFKTDVVPICQDRTKQYYAGYAPATNATKVSYFTLSFDNRKYPCNGHLLVTPARYTDISCYLF